MCLFFSCYEYKTDLDDSIKVLCRHVEVLVDVSRPRVLSKVLARSNVELHDRAGISGEKVQLANSDASPIANSNSKQ